MHAVLIMLKPGQQNKFRDCKKATARIVALPIMVVKTRWNMTLEWLEQGYRLLEFTCKWLRNPTFTDYWALFTSQDQWTIVKYVMEVFRRFRYWTLWMSKRHTVTLDHAIRVYNGMFDHMDRVIEVCRK